MVYRELYMRTRSIVYIQIYIQVSVVYIRGLEAPVLQWNHFVTFNFTSNVAYLSGFEVHLVTWFFWAARGHQRLPWPQSWAVRPQDLDAPDRVLIGGQDQEPEAVALHGRFVQSCNDGGLIGLKSCQVGSSPKDLKALVEWILVTLLISSREWAY